MNLIVGIDEVGRGCWAGPLVAGAVLLKTSISGLNDSKLLSKKRREVLAIQIEQTAVYGLGWVWPDQIDTVGLTCAVGIAMKAALSQISEPYVHIIVDGNYNYLKDSPDASRLSRIECVIGADKLIQEVSAASILAKVARDNYMTKQSLQYPDYGFESHVGYGTKQHIEALKRFGVCRLHRLSYKPIKAFLI